MMLLTMDNNTGTANNDHRVHRNNNENVDDVNDIDTILISWISSLFIDTIFWSRYWFVNWYRYYFFKTWLKYWFKNIPSNLVSYSSIFPSDEKLQVFTKLLFKSNILHYSFDQSNVFPHLFGQPYCM